jgi:hypothetical protein
LIRYDLKRKASKVIVADTKTVTPWPAISKDGKKIAVAEHTSSYVKGSREVKHKLWIIVYDLDGKQLSRTKVDEVTSPHPDAASTTEENRSFAALNWSGPADKLLLVTLERAGIFDLTKEKFTSLDNSRDKALGLGPGDKILVTPDVVPIPYYNRPVRPDGKGFLAMYGDSVRTLIFCDWDGGVTFFGGIPKEGIPEPTHCAWVKNTFRFYTTEGTTDADTEGGKLKVKDSTDKTTVIPPKGDPIRFFPFAGDDSLLCIFHEPKRTGSRGICEESREFRFEIQRPTINQRKVILRGEDYCMGSWGIYEIFPSPDDKLVAVRFVDLKQKAERILVIDAKGEIIADITVDK